MTLSVAQDFLRFLRPGVAEDLIEASKGNKSWLQIATRLKRSRNALYVGVALAVIGAIGSVLVGPGIPFIATVALGAVVAIAAAKIIHTQVLKFRKT